MFVVMKNKLTVHILVFRVVTSDSDVIPPSIFSNDLKGCPHGVMVKALDCTIVVSEFELQSHYYVHFQTNTLGKGMNLLILPSMG